MSHAFLSLAIRSCCEARAPSSSSIRRLLNKIPSSLVQHSSRTRSVVVSPIARNHVIRGIRPLSLSARVQVRQRFTKLHQDTFPGEVLEATTTIASHTEGQPDAEQWRDYDPAGGLPLPDGELSQAQIHTIFGETTSVEEGNYILCVLHWRRSSGALIDVGVDFPKTMDVSRNQAFRGLEWLRQKYPNVDEEALGAKWAEEESTRMRQELQDRAVKYKLYKPVQGDDAAAEEQEMIEEEPVEEQSQQGTAYGRERSGTSAVEGLVGALRERAAQKEAARVIAIAQKEKALLHANRGPLELAGGVQPTIGVKRYGTLAVALHEPTKLATLKAVDRKPWVQYYEKQAAIVQENIIPRMGLVKRLVPSTLTVMAVLAFCLYLSDNYTPPPSIARLFPNVPSSVATIGGLTAMLVGSFFLSRLPPLWRLNNKYCTVVPAYPHAASIVGAIFRHDTFTHLTTNLITLWLVGLSLNEDVGRGTYLAIFLGTGVLGTYSALTYNVLRGNWTTYIYGCSGAVMGSLGALCMLRPNGMVSIMGYELPMAAWLLLLFVGGAEVLAAFRARRVTEVTKYGVDYAGHITGLLSGVAAGSYLKYRYSAQKQHDRESIAMTYIG